MSRHGYRCLNQFHVDQHNHRSLYCFSFRYSTFRPDCRPPVIRSDVCQYISILHFYGWWSHGFHCVEFPVMQMTKLQQINSTAETIIGIFFNVTSDIKVDSWFMSLTFFCYQNLAKYSYWGDMLMVRGCHKVPQPSAGFLHTQYSRLLFLRRAQITGYATVPLTRREFSLSRNCFMNNHTLGLGVSKAAGRKAEPPPWSSYIISCSLRKTVYCCVGVWVVSYGRDAIP